MRTMEWAARRDHLGGVPRKMIFTAVGAFAKAVANLLNTTTVHNLETLLRLVQNRPPRVPLLTVSNHMSTLDDPVMWGMKGFPITDAELGRWVLAAEDICFKNPVLSYMFRLGKCIPITRGGRIYQEHMNEALDWLTDGAWLHTFPEGKVHQEDAAIQRLKWGTASLISRAPVTPIVLPIVHRGFEKACPRITCLVEGHPFHCGIRIVIGDPIAFDIPQLKQKAMQLSRLRDATLPQHGWPKTICGLDEAAQQCLYTTISKPCRSSAASAKTTEHWI